MPIASNSLPTDIETLQRLVVLQQSAIDERDEQLAQFRRLNADTHSELERKKAEALHLHVWIEKLELQIARLKRMQFGRSSERLVHIEQLELIVEELEACQRYSNNPHLGARQKSWTIRRGSSCIHTRIDFELCGSTSSWANESA